MLVCKECGLEKDPSLFYESDKRTCKECVKARTKRNRELKREYYKEYDRNRPNKQDRVDKCSARVRMMRLEDPEFKAKIDSTKAKWIQENPHKRLAQHAANNALKSGKLERKFECEHCGAADKKLQKHHWSYEPEHWLDIIWLCPKCHGAEHKRLNDLGRDPDKQHSNKQPSEI